MNTNLLNNNKNISADANYSTEATTNTATLYNNPTTTPTTPTNTVSPLENKPLNNNNTHHLTHHNHNSTSHSSHNSASHSNHNSIPTTDIVLLSVGITLLVSFTIAMVTMIAKEVKRARNQIKELKKEQTKAQTSNTCEAASEPLLSQNIHDVNRPLRA